MNFPKNSLRLTLLILMMLVGCDKPENFLYFQPNPAPEQKSELPGSLAGQVTNALNGFALSGVTITIHPLTAGQIDTITQTDQTGTYLVDNLPSGNYTVDFTLFGFSPITGVPVTVLPSVQADLNESMSELLNQGQFRIVTTWCAPTNRAVRDVDSYLHIPGEAVDHPLGFANLNDNMGASLDHDDTQWFGPETITIATLKQGTYQYYVNNYNVRNDFSALGNSSVVVQVYDGAQLVKTYQVPQGIGTTYAVFNLVNGNIVDVEAYDDTLYVY